MRERRKRKRKKKERERYRVRLFLIYLFQVVKSPLKHQVDVCPLMMQFHKYRHQPSKEQRVGG